MFFILLFLLLLLAVLFYTENHPACHSVKIRIIVSTIIQQLSEFLRNIQKKSDQNHQAKKQQSVYHQTVAKTKSRILIMAVFLLTNVLASLLKDSLCKLVLMNMKYRCSM